jgi:hypothetical protein
LFFPGGTHIIFIPSLLAGISHIAPPKTPGGAGIHSLSYVQGGEETGNISMVTGGEIRTINPSELKDIIEKELKV